MHNSEVGRLEEAGNVSQIVLASPFAPSYPEWRETSNEIALRGRRPSRATVAFSQKISEATDLRAIRRKHAAHEAISQRIPEGRNVVRLSVIERGDSPASLSATSEPARVFSLEEWKKGMPGKSNDAHKDTEVPDGTKHTKEQIRQMTTSEKLVRLMNLISSELSEDQMDRILSSVEDIALEKHAKS